MGRKRCGKNIVGKGEIARYETLWDNSKFDENGRKFFKRVENIVGKTLWEKENLLVMRH